MANDDNTSDRLVRGFPTYTLRKMLVMVLALGMLVAAVREFRFYVLTSGGLLAGVILTVLGLIVGATIGQVRQARVLVVLASAVLFLGMINNWVAGDRFLQWSLACAATGLLVGALSVEAADDGDREAHHDDAAMRE